MKKAPTMVQVDGESMTLTQAARLHGLSLALVSVRKSRGVTGEALFAPPHFRLGRPTQGAASRIAEFFRANPDEVLMSEDVAAKFDVPLERVSHLMYQVRRLGVNARLVWAVVR